MMNFPIGGGTSSVELNRTAKGEYTWGIKLYFLGNSMAEIRRNLGNTLKARVILEHVLGQEIVPSDEMAATLRRLEDAVRKAGKKEAEKPPEGEGK